MIKYIDYLLDKVWSEWQHEGSACSLGYPSQDASAAIKAGGNGTGLNIERNPQAEYLDKLILRLTKIQIKSIKIRYLYGYPDWYVADKFKIPESTHRNRIYKAHENISNFLIEENPFNWHE